MPRKRLILSRCQFLAQDLVDACEYGLHLEWLTGTNPRSNHQEGTRGFVFARTRGEAAAVISKGDVIVPSMFAGRRLPVAL